jgi:hypothetical protein
MDEIEGAQAREHATNQFVNERKTEQHRERRQIQQSMTLLQNVLHIP